MFSFSWIVVLELGPKVVTTTSTMAYDVVFANIHEENYVLQAVVCWENTGTSLAVLHVNRNPSALAPKSAGLEFLPMNCPELPKLLDSHVMSPCLLANSTFWLKSRCVIMPCFFRWIPQWTCYVLAWMKWPYLLLKSRRVVVFVQNLSAQNNWNIHICLSELSLSPSFVAGFWAPDPRKCQPGHLRSTAGAPIGQRSGPTALQKVRSLVGQTWSKKACAVKFTVCYCKSSFWENLPFHIPPIQASFILLPGAQNKKTAFETCSDKCLESGGTDS